MAIFVNANVNNGTHYVLSLNPTYSEAYLSTRNAIKKDAEM